MRARRDSVYETKAMKERTDDPTPEDAYRVAQLALARANRIEAGIDILDAETRLLEQRVADLTEQLP